MGGQGGEGRKSADGCRANFSLHPNSSERQKAWSSFNLLIFFANNYQKSSRFSTIRNRKIEAGLFLTMQLVDARWAPYGRPHQRDGMGWPEFRFGSTVVI